MSNELAVMVDTFRPLSLGEAARAVRNTDPATGFEQHGFLNVLTATGAAIDGARKDDLANVLAQRDPAVVAEWVRALSVRVREPFRSFGTCSVAEPVDDLVRLGLLERRPMSEEYSCPT